jgi:hypothetical protein
MASAESDYLEKRGQQIARKQKMVTYNISLFAFAGSILFGGFNTVKQAWEKPKELVVLQSAEAEQK